MKSPTARLASLCLGVSVAACSRGPVELGFWMDPVAYQSPRIGDPITPTELATIDTIARGEIAKAFEPFDVSITANKNARYKVATVADLRDQRFRRRQSTYAGQSRAIAGFGGSGAVSFEYVANGAMVFAPPSAGRAEVITALGRGLGRVAIHEFLHQLLPKAPIDDSDDSRSYEGNTAAMVEGYFGDLHWGIAEPLLERRFPKR